jgi:hypothetical protein
VISVLSVTSGAAARFGFEALIPEADGVGTGAVAPSQRFQVGFAGTVGLADIFGAAGFKLGRVGR